MLVVLSFGESWQLLPLEHLHAMLGGLNIASVIQADWYFRGSFWEGAVHTDPHFKNLSVFTGELSKDNLTSWNALLAWYHRYIVRSFIFNMKKDVFNNQLCSLLGSNVFDRMSVCIIFCICIESILIQCTAPASIFTYLTIQKASLCPPPPPVLHTVCVGAMIYMLCCAKYLCACVKHVGILTVM